MSTPLEEQLRPVILTIDDREHPPLPIVQLPMDERYRGRPTVLLLQYLEMGELFPEARAAVLAELARRGVPPPTA
jgi:hypothetical protein